MVALMQDHCEHKTGPAGRDSQPRGTVFRFSAARLDRIAGKQMKDMGAVVTGEKIFIAGGRGSSSIECFDPSDGPAGRLTVVSLTVCIWSQIFRMLS